MPAAEDALQRGPFINTWLVASTFDNDKNNSGFERDWIDESNTLPAEGDKAGGTTWSYFDDRLFSRNYDDYQDLFSYFKVKQGKSVAAKVVYTHVYVHSAMAQKAQLRVGADNQFKAWLNGKPVVSSTKSTPYRDSVKADVELQQGWNRLLLKIANRQDGRLGFYARLCKSDGTQVPGLTFSVNRGEKLAISTKHMAAAKTPTMPAAFREWPYVGASAFHASNNVQDFLHKPQIAMQASDFTFLAQGGRPPYTWKLTAGKLPKGLTLESNGTITGTVDVAVKLGEYKFEVQVADKSGQTAKKQLSLTVNERPNKWYEEARLGALIHMPGCLPDDMFPHFAKTMKRQGYQLGLPISYNNGGGQYYWPSIFNPNTPHADVVGKYKKALEAEGIKFGMYMGNLHRPENGGANGAILAVEDAIRHHKPVAFWFDWAAWDCVSVDAIYSMIKSYNPETIVILNGARTMSNGDWDVICTEGWGAWGDNMWDVWPFRLEWPKRHSMETWRMPADPAFKPSKDITPDWQEYLRVQVSLIAQGFIANIDHSPTIRSGMSDLTPDGHLKNLHESPVWACHEKMADWASPDGMPPLYESYTNVNPGPVQDAAWGYSTINLARNTVYLHVMKNYRGKTGLPAGNVLTAAPIYRKVKSVRWMNQNQTVPFEQKDGRLTIKIDGIAPDPVDTIFKIELSQSLPPLPPMTLWKRKAIPPGNLACHKPTRLLSNRDSRGLMPGSTNFARYGVDGYRNTYAFAGGEYPWTYHVDLGKAHPVSRIVIHFCPYGYATEYKIMLSVDGKTWKDMAHVKDCKGGTAKHAFAPTDARYVRVRSLKPDGPNQTGAQMIVSELEVY